MLLPRHTQPRMRHKIPKRQRLRQPTHTTRQKRTNLAQHHLQRRVVLHQMMHLHHTQPPTRNRIRRPIHPQQRRRQTHPSPGRPHRQARPPRRGQPAAPRRSPVPRPAATPPAPAPAGPVTRTPCADVVPVHDLLQRTHERVEPIAGIEAEHERLRIHVGAVAGSHQMVEEDAFLQRRQRIHIPHILRTTSRPHHTTNLLRRQIHQRQHLRRNHRRTIRNQIRRHHHPDTTTSRSQPSRIGAANNARTDTDTPRTRNRSTNDTANNECPPNRKKLSSTPTDSNPNTSAKT